MKHEVTELVFLIDRSGSMAGLEDDTIGGFNTMLKQQQAVEGDVYVTVLLFDDLYELLCDHEDIRQVKPLTARDYVPQGSTALLDAIERTIHRIKKTQEDTGVREKVLFFILTDGQENSSLRCTFPMIRSQIEHQKEKYGWEFLFFGANMDAIAEAAKFGIGADRAQNYRADSVGTTSVYRTMSAVSTAFRTGHGFPCDDSHGLDRSQSDEPKTPQEAVAKLRNAVGGLQQAIHGLRHEFEELHGVAAANHGKIPDVNEILREVMGYEPGEEESK